jgi:PAS domain S-box-containing protein
MSDSRLEQRETEGAELAAVRAFAESIVDTVHDPLLVLDSELRVVSASREFCRTFAVSTEETKGRLIYDLGNRQWDIPALRALLEEILPQKSMLRDFEVEHEFEHIGRKMMLLNARRLHQQPGAPEMILLAIEDATARRDVENAKREAETRFTEMVKNVRDHSIFLTDPKGIITSWNVAAERVFGYVGEETVGKHFSLIFTPEDIAARLPEQELREARELGRAEDERWHVRKGGERFWALGIVSPLRDAEGNITGFSKILRDMTERKRLENKSRESEDRFRLMVQRVQEYAIVFMDEKGDVTSWNEGAERILGYRDGEVIGRSAALFFVEEDVQKGLPRKELEIAAREGTATDECWLRRKDGTRFWANVVTTAIRGEDIGLQGFAKIVQDLSERRRNEDALQEKETRLRVALSAARMGIWVWDLHSNREYLDQNLHRLLGVPFGETIDTFEKFLECVYVADRAAVDQAFHKSIHEQIPLNIEFRVVWPDGSLHWLKDQGEVLRDAAGEAATFTGACVDITDRKQAEANLRELNAVLDQRVQEQTSALLQSQDRLRQLTSQLAKAEQQERKRIAAVLHDHVQQFLVAAKMRVEMTPTTAARLQTTSQLLDEALNATRSLAAELVPPLLYEHGLEAALKWLASRMNEQHDILILVSGEQQLSLSDELRAMIFQIARELLLNVVKHAKTDHAWVNVQQSDGEIVLSVRDEGAGFDPDSARERPASFGLFHIRERISYVGGQIQVDSQPGGGTQVTVTVPSRNPVSPGSVSEPSESVTAAVDTGAGIRLLVVDDHQIVRSGIVGLLESDPKIEGIREAGDGIEAIETARHFRPDVIIMDVNMPGMNGIEATRQIKAEMPEVRIIAFSLHREPDMAQAMRDAGAEDFVPKDAHSDMLMRAIHASR